MTQINVINRKTKEVYTYLFLNFRQIQY